MQFNCDLVAREFDALGLHFENIMKIDGSDKLKSEIMRHKEFMRKLYEMVSDQNKICGQATERNNSH
jgi:hypothetical protein